MTMSYWQKVTAAFLPLPAPAPRLQSLTLPHSCPHSLQTDTCNVITLTQRTRTVRILHRAHIVLTLTPLA